MARALGFSNMEGAELLAKRRLPSSVYLYLRGGTEAGLTLQANHRAFEEVEFLPHAAGPSVSRDLTTTVLGCELSLPVILAPAGFLRLAHHGAEAAAARAATRAKTAVALSTMASTDVTDMRAATSGPLFFQLYFAGGRPAAEVAIERAKAAHCEALLVTVDLATGAGREGPPRSRAIPMRVDLKTALRYAPEMVPHPRWVANFLRGGRRLETPNVRLSEEGPPLSAAEASVSMRSSAPTWDDFAWIRERWPGRLVVKGILRPDDARRARDVGADAVSISNHGGNALDSSPATLRMVPAVVAAVGDEIEVLMDGGVRRGSDVVKAMALGARAVMVGRAYVWPLAVAGEAGVTHAVELLRQGISRTLTLLGCPSLSELDGSYVEVPASWR